MSRWPKDSQAALIKFYGDPGTGEVAEQLVSITPPFQMFYDKKPMRPNRLLVHRKAAASFDAAFRKIWDYYGHDQKLINKLRISWSSGTYAPRKVRGSKDKWSNHAYAAAWDVDAEDNPLGQKKNTIPMPVVAAFKSEGFSWGGDYKNRKDNMHFELCDRGEPQRTFDEWLRFYECPPGAVVVAPSRVDSEPSRSVESVDVEVIQKRLDEVGYHEVGEIDGKLGGKTIGAIASFRSDRHLPGVAVIDDALVRELQRAKDEGWMRPIAKERAEATVDELAPKLPEIKAAQNASWWSKVQGWFSSIFGGVSATAVATSFMSAKEQVDPVRSWFGDVVPIGLGLLLVIGTVVLAIFLAKRASGAANEAADESTKAYQEGSRS